MSKVSWAKGVLQKPTIDTSRGAGTECGGSGDDGSGGALTALLAGAKAGTAGPVGVQGRHGSPSRGSSPVARGNRSPSARRSPPPGKRGRGSGSSSGSGGEGEERKKIGDENGGDDPAGNERPESPPPPKFAILPEDQPEYCPHTALLGIERKHNATDEAKKILKQMKGRAEQQKPKVHITAGMVRKGWIPEFLEENEEYRGMIKSSIADVKNRRRAVNRSVGLLFGDGGAAMGAAFGGSGDARRNALHGMGGPALRVRSSSAMRRRGTNNSLSMFRRGSSGVGGGNTDLRLRRPGHEELTGSAHNRQAHQRAKRGMAMLQRSTTLAVEGGLEEIPFLEADPSHAETTPRGELIKTLEAQNSGRDVARQERARQQERRQGANGASTVDRSKRSQQRSGADGGIPGAHGQARRASSANSVTGRRRSKTGNAKPAAQGCPTTVRDAEAMAMPTEEDAVHAMETEPLLLHAFLVTAKSFGLDDPRTEATIAHLRQCYRAQGPAKAEDLHELSEDLENHFRKIRSAIGSTSKIAKQIYVRADLPPVTLVQPQALARAANSNRRRSRMRRFMRRLSSGSMMSAATSQSPSPASDDDASPRRFFGRAMSDQAGLPSARRNSDRINGGRVGDVDGGTGAVGAGLIALRNQFNAAQQQEEQVEQRQQNLHSLVQDTVGEQESYGSDTETESTDSSSQATNEQDFLLQYPVSLELMEDYPALEHTVYPTWKSSFINADVVLTDGQDAGASAESATQESEMLLHASGTLSTASAAIPGAGSGTATSPAKTPTKENEAATEAGGTGTLLHSTMRAGRHAVQKKQGKVTEADILSRISAHEYISASDACLQSSRMDLFRVALAAARSYPTHDDFNAVVSLCVMHAPILVGEPVILQYSYEHRGAPKAHPVDDMLALVRLPSPDVPINKMLQQGRVDAWCVVPAGNRGTVICDGKVTGIGWYRFAYLMSSSQCVVAATEPLKVQFVEAELTVPQTPKLCGQIVEVTYKMGYRCVYHSDQDVIGFVPSDKPIALENCTYAEPLSEENEGVHLIRAPPLPGTYRVCIFLGESYPSHMVAAKSEPIFVYNNFEAHRFNELRRNRDVRVYLSTRWDMDMERHEFWKEIVPVLQQACDNRGVALNVVDLRTEVATRHALKEKALLSREGLKSVLDAVDYARPSFFVACVGEYADVDIDLADVRSANYLDAYASAEDNAHNILLAHHPWITKANTLSLGNSLQAYEVMWAAILPFRQDESWKELAPGRNARGLIPKSIIMTRHPELRSALHPELQTAPSGVRETIAYFTKLKKAAADLVARAREVDGITIDEHYASSTTFRDNLTAFLCSQIEETYPIQSESLNMGKEDRFMLMAWDELLRKRWPSRSRRWVDMDDTVYVREDAHNFQHSMTILYNTLARNTAVKMTDAHLQAHGQQSRSPSPTHPSGGNVSGPGDRRMESKGRDRRRHSPPALLPGSSSDNNSTEGQDRIVARRRALPARAGLNHSPSSRRRATGARGKRATRVGLPIVGIAGDGAGPEDSDAAERTDHPSGERIGVGAGGIWGGDQQLMSHPALTPYTLRQLLSIHASVPKRDDFSAPYGEAPPAAGANADSGLAKARGLLGGGGGGSPWATGSHHRGAQRNAGKDGAAPTSIPTGFNWEGAEGPVFRQGVLVIADAHGTGLTMALRAWIRSLTVSTTGTEPGLEPLLPEGEDSNHNGNAEEHRASQTDDDTDESDQYEDIGPPVRVTNSMPVIELVSRQLPHVLRANQRLGRRQRNALNRPWKDQRGFPILDHSSNFGFHLYMPAEDGRPRLSALVYIDLSLPGEQWDPDKVAFTIIRTVRHLMDIDVPLPDFMPGIAQRHLSEWLDLAGKHGPLVLILDGLDYMRPTDEHMFESDAADVLAGARVDSPNPRGRSESPDGHIGLRSDHHHHHHGPGNRGAHRAPSTGPGAGAHRRTSPRPDSRGAPATAAARDAAAGATATATTDDGKKIGELDWLPRTFHKAVRVIATCGTHSTAFTECQEIQGWTVIRRRSHLTNVPREWRPVMRAFQSHSTAREDIKYLSCVWNFCRFFGLHLGSAKKDDRRSSCATHRDGPDLSDSSVSSDEDNGHDAVSLDMSAPSSTDDDDDDDLISYPGRELFQSPGALDHGHGAAMAASHRVEVQPGSPTEAAVRVPFMSAPVAVSGSMDSPPRGGGMAVQAASAAASPRTPRRGPTGAVQIRVRKPTLRRGQARLSASRNLAQTNFRRFRFPLPPLNPHLLMRCLKRTGRAVEVFLLWIHQLHAICPEAMAALALIRLSHTGLSEFELRRSLPGVIHSMDAPRGLSRRESGNSQGETSPDPETASPRLRFKAGTAGESTSTLDLRGVSRRGSGKRRSSRARNARHHKLMSYTQWSEIADKVRPLCLQSTGLYRLCDRDLQAAVDIFLRRNVRTHLTCAAKLTTTFNSTRPSRRRATELPLLLMRYMYLAESAKRASTMQMRATLDADAIAKYMNHPQLQGQAAAAAEEGAPTSKVLNKKFFDGLPGTAEKGSADKDANGGAAGPSPDITHTPVTAAVGGGGGASSTGQRTNPTTPRPGSATHNTVNPSSSAAAQASEWFLKCITDISMLGYLAMPANQRDLALHMDTALSLVASPHEIIRRLLLSFEAHFEVRMSEKQLEAERLKAERALTAGPSHRSSRKQLAEEAEARQRKLRVYTEYEMLGFHTVDGSAHFGTSGSMMLCRVADTAMRHLGLLPRAQRLAESALMNVMGVSAMTKEAFAHPDPARVLPESAGGRPVPILIECIRVLMRIYFVRIYGRYLRASTVSGEDRTHVAHKSPDSGRHRKSVSVAGGGESSTGSTPLVSPVSSPRRARDEADIPSIQNLRYLRYLGRIDPYQIRDQPLAVVSERVELVRDEAVQIRAALIAAGHTRNANMVEIWDLDHDISVLQTRISGGGRGRLKRLLVGSRTHGVNESGGSSAQSSARSSASTTPRNEGHAARTGAGTLSQLVGARDSLLKGDVFGDTEESAAPRHIVQEVHTGDGEPPIKLKVAINEKDHAARGARSIMMALKERRGAV